MKRSREAAGLSVFAAAACLILGALIAVLVSAGGAA